VTISSDAIPLAKLETLDPKVIFSENYIKNLATLSKTLAQCFPHGLLKFQKVCSLFKALENGHFKLP